MDTSETGLEKIIVDWLVQHNGYEQETSHAYNKDFANQDFQNFVNARVFQAAVSQLTQIQT